MAKAKGVPVGLGMLLLSLLARRDMYGYEMIEALRQRSNQVFDLKAGTLYPLLHALQAQDYITAADRDAAGGRVRRYYAITPLGRKALEEQRGQWQVYADAVRNVLGGVLCGG